MALRSEALDEIEKEWHHTCAWYVHELVMSYSCVVSMHGSVVMAVKIKHLNHDGIGGVPEQMSLACM